MHAVLQEISLYAKENTEIAHWHSLPAFYWLSSYVASHYLAVAPQLAAKDIFYCTVYNIVLN
jgi:hypothetical protein